MPKCPFASWQPIGYDGGAYVGGPVRIVLHTTDGSSMAAAIQEFRTHRYASHFVVDEHQIAQLIDTGVASCALQHTSDPQTNRLMAIQVEMVAFAAKPKSPVLLANVAKLLRWIETTHGVPQVWPNGPCKPAVNGRDGNVHNRSVAGWAKGGYFGHEHVPENIHWDPALTPAETAVLMGIPVAASRLRFGKKPARPEAQPKLKFSTYAVALPEPPDSFGYDSLLPADSGMLGNDAVGDCVIAGAEHETMLWTKFSGTPASFTAQTALADYSAITGYDPNDPSSDQGTDMQAAASYRRKTGVRDASGVLHKVAGYVSIARGALAQHKLAAWLFGAAGGGPQVSRAQVDQFDRGEPWNGPLEVSSAGGHYVPLVGFRDGYLLVVTWGRVQRVSPDFFVANNDESVAYFSQEFLKADLNPVGFNTAQLQTDLAAIASSTGVNAM